MQVARAHHGSRLDRFLADVLARTLHVSRSEVQRWLSAGRVRINGVVSASAKHHVAEGDVVDVEPLAPARSEALAEADVVFDIVYLDDDIVVVNKPPGLVVHPAAGHAGGTLVNGLLGRGLFRAFDGEEGEDAHLRPGIVHRIDKGTSGLLVVARNAVARERLKMQFQAHTIERAYEALVVGAASSQTFSSFHGRHPTARLKFTGKVRTGRRAVTHVEVEETFDAATRVRCTLETGRTHQIRVHLSEGGTPILGDELYGKPPKDPALRAIAKSLGRPALHAAVLGFVHPTSEKNVRFEAEVPPDFAAALASLRTSA